MIDHVNIPVRRLDVSEPFYRDVLDVLGYQSFGRDGPVAGFGQGTWMFGIIETTGDFPSMHFAFSAKSRRIVDEFYNAALAAGGQTNGAPGLRAAYGRGYYAAYVIDPNGHNVESVNRG